MKKCIVAFLFLFVAFSSGAQVTWTGAPTGGSWAVGTNWSSGVVPTATDAVLLQSAATDTLMITNVPRTVTLTQLRINNAKVRFTGDSAVVMTLTGAAGVDFSIAANAALVLSGGSVAAPFQINLATGATGEVFGFMQLTGSTTGISHTHKLNALDSNAVFFKSGSTFVFGPLTSGNPFGLGVAPSGMKSMTFENGATFVQNGGSNPFAATAPSSVTVFASASTFKINGTGTASMGGRIYGNLEFNNAGYTASSTATTPSIVNGNLTVNMGSPIFTAAGGMEIKGNITVAAGASLKFGSATACLLKLNGTTEQVITNSGTISFDPLGLTTQLTLDNAAGARLVGNDVKVTKIALTNGKIRLGNSNLVMTTANTPITGGSANNFIVTDGTGKLTIPASAATAAIFPIGLTATNGDVNQVEIVSTTADTISMRVIAKPTMAFTSVNHAVSRAWEISRLGNSGADSIKFGYNNNQVGSFTPANSAMAIAIQGAANWAALQSNLTPTVGTINDKKITTSAAVVNYGTFALGTTGRVGAPNSVASLAEEKGVRVYPTLASENITIESKNEGTETFRIVDAQGRVLKTGNFVKQTNVNITDLAAGVYFVNLNGATVRLVKQ
ncbi:MAG: hypothetical protein RL757_544 [Bacteroidota bacterium]|jgi:hypothetical protein